jgi:hypothetical protein
LRDLIDRGEALPARYRHLLFAEPHEAELIWPGKTHEVTNVVLPFQSIEQIDEPRSGTAAAQSDLFQMDHATGRQSGGWTNKLIWGDNKLVLSSLKNGLLRREIEKAGGLKLVYIDPPFDVGADFSFDIEVGESDTVTKEPSVIEDIAYRDTWGRGADSFISMIHERLILIRELLAGDGSIYVHCDPPDAALMSPLEFWPQSASSTNFGQSEAASARDADIELATPTISAKAATLDNRIVEPFIRIRRPTDPPLTNQNFRNNHSMILTQDLRSTFAQYSNIPKGARTA